MEFKGKNLYPNSGLTSLLFKQVPYVVKWEEDVIKERKEKYLEEHPEVVEQQKKEQALKDLYPEDEKYNFTIKVAVHFGYNGGNYAGSQM